MLNVAHLEGLYNIAPFLVGKNYQQLWVTLRDVIVLEI